jgi:hypothetical protein
MVLRAAHRLALKVLPDHAQKFSRRDITLAQLLACVVLREFYRLSWRLNSHLRVSPRASCRRSHAVSVATVADRVGPIAELSPQQSRR